jgi:hypothetical protein
MKLPLPHVFTLILCLSAEILAGRVDAPAQESGAINLSEYQPDGAQSSSGSVRRGKVGVITSLLFPNMGL